VRKNIEARKNIFGAKGLRCGFLFESNGRLPPFSPVEFKGRCDLGEGQNSGKKDKLLLRGYSGFIGAMVTAQGKVMHPVAHCHGDLAPTQSAGRLRLLLGPRFSECSWSGSSYRSRVRSD